MNFLKLILKRIITKKRPKNFYIDINNINIPVIYRTMYLQMNQKERKKFLDAVWQDKQNGLLKDW